MATATAGMTCIACRVAFSSFKDQKDHFRTDWHRYNLQRKAALLPCVSYSVFSSRESESTRKVAEEKAKSEGSHAVFECTACRKKYNSSGALDTHLASKKHKAVLAEQSETATAAPSSAAASAGPASGGGIASTAAVQPALEAPSDTAIPVPEPMWQQEHAAFLERYVSVYETALTGEEQTALEQVIKAGVLLDPLQCFCCSAAQPDFESLLQHAAREHGFFIPDIKYVVNAAGLMEYLSRKVSLLHICLGCDKTFASLDAVQSHMQDKYHGRLLEYVGDEAEFEPFYDYTSSYPNGEIVPFNPDTQPHVDASSMELVLPSGRTLGHRALARYYRQRLATEDTREEVVASRMAAQSRMLAWYSGADALAIRANRDFEAAGRYAKRGIDDRAAWANNRTKARHYRRQVDNAG